MGAIERIKTKIKGALSSGGICFGAGNSIETDNANFFWDNTNKRLGIGTAIPPNQLTIAGTTTHLQLFRNATSGGVTIDFRTASGSPSSGIQTQIGHSRTNSPSNGDTAIIFSNTRSGAALSEAARVDGNNNLLLGVTAAGTSGQKVVGVGTGTEPSSSPADMIQLYSVDLSAGNATLGLRTETAVAADVGIVSTDSLTVRINGASYKIPLVAV